MSFESQQASVKSDAGLGRMDNSLRLGRLQRVDLRTIWDHEATSFTPWLAKPDNLSLLADAIGAELSVEAQEQGVGPFRADILCKDMTTERWVLIENQIERTDHGHLGQLITYAAGLHAVTIVWIAARFTEEHRAALDWLNEVTSEEVSFFGLEVELWRIGDSPAAPKFNVVSKPNTFVKHQVAQRSQPTERGNAYLEYWTAFKQYADEHATVVRPQKPSTSHWTNFSIGRSTFSLRAMAGMRDRWVMVDLAAYDDAEKRIISHLESMRDRIDERIPDLVWNRKEGKKESAIELIRRDFDPNDRAQWEQQHIWILESIEALHRVIAPLIRNL